jgi:hypothetical protein
VLIFSEHMDAADGQRMFRHACALGLEGIVWKRNSAQPNARVLVDSLHAGRSSTTLADIAALPRRNRTVDLSGKRLQQHQLARCSCSSSRLPYLEGTSGSIPLFLIASDARAEARNSISCLEASISLEPATTAAENT